MTSSAWSTPSYFFTYSLKQATHRSLPYDAGSTVCTVSAHPHLLIFAAYMQVSSPSAVSGRQEYQLGASLPKDDALLRRNRTKFCSFGRCARFPLIIPAIFSEGNRSIWASSWACDSLWPISTPALRLGPREQWRSSTSRVILGIFGDIAQVLGHTTSPYSSFQW